MSWNRLPAHITGSVDEELLLRNAYLATENKILHGQLKGRLRLTDGERRTLAEIGKRPGRQALAEVASIAERRVSSVKSECLGHLQGNPGPGPVGLDRSTVDSSGREVHRCEVWRVVKAGDWNRR